MIFIIIELLKNFTILKFDKSGTFHTTKSHKHAIVTLLKGVDFKTSQELSARYNCRITRPKNNNYLNQLNIKIDEMNKKNHLIDKKQKE